MLRLEHEVVVVLGQQALDDRLAAHAVALAMGEQRPKVRAPAPEVVVDVDGGDGRGPQAPLEGGQTLGHGQRMGEQRVAALEFEVVDDVDQQQDDRCVVRRVAVEVGVLGRHAVRGPRYTEYHLVR